ncbi:hypothetical protein NOJ16_25265 [Neorhizobium galegae]|nr:hypothetical protein [Neorhizobium galegae]MCQ1854612.1 hypothetical protein [Neorhizobium galegae]
MYSPSFFLLSQPRRARPRASVPSGERIDNQVANEEWLATRKMEERHQLEMPLPGDQRKEFVISIDTAMFVAPNPIQREASSLLFAAPDLYSDRTAVRSSTMDNATEPGFVSPQPSLSQR